MSSTIYDIPTAAETAPVSTLASAMFFGTVVFTTVAWAVRAWRLGDHKSVIMAAATEPSPPRATALDLRNAASVFGLLYHTSILGLILGYAYLCEYHPPFPHAGKYYNRDEFFFLTALMFGAACFSVKKQYPHPPPQQQQHQLNDCATTANASAMMTTKNGVIKMNGNTPDEMTGTTTIPTCYGNSSSSSTSSSRSVAPANDKTEILNREQTEEWKGWMQFIFLLYHYYHAEEVYNCIRVMITCYVWMTGFGNFSFFYIKGDYGLVRVLQMLWRLNFLVFFLCLTQGTTYILYYICLLHTYYFLMVYVTMHIGQSVNHAKYGVRYKMMAVACIIYVVWDLPTPFFRIFHRPFLGETPKVGATAGSLWEWYFRSSLDHWSTLLGMTFALNFPITSLFFRKLEAEPLWKHVLAKTIMGLALASATLWWVLGPFRHNKFQYNQTNAYFAWIPLYTYIYFRNLTPWLRNHTLHLLHQIGTTTLETYLMQHHIWLTSDAKSLLTLLPGWPLMNFLLVSVLYFAVSRRLYRLTLYLRGMILPDHNNNRQHQQQQQQQHRNTCLRNLLGMGFVLGSYGAIALILDQAGMLTLSSVFAVSLGSGIILYHFLLRMTLGSRCCRDSKNNCSPDTASAMNGASAPASVSASSLPSSLQPPSSLQKWCPLPLLAGTLTIYAVGAVWNHMATNGASKIIPLPAYCQHFVQQGVWIPVHACNEGVQGEVYRDYGISALGTCAAVSSTRSDSSNNNNYNNNNAVEISSGDTAVWGWKANPSRSRCRFVQRDSTSLLKLLNHRQFTFLGDSSVRHMFHATRRIVGDRFAGVYNTTIEKWTDVPVQTYKGFGINFRWAPYTDDLINHVRNIIESTEESTASTSNYPDLLVLGGGAWDRLHRYNSSGDATQLAQQVQTLAIELKNLQALGIPVVWITPTTINNWALLTDEKRENINEENMVALRQMYHEKGISDSVSFVLDGTIYTRSRVSESYDGVHYPLAVYDAGAQILANALDWLLLGAPRNDAFIAPTPGTMAHPFYGLVVLVLVTVMIFRFDGMLGFSFLAGLIVPGVRPSTLFDEAFSSLHAKCGLPAMSSSTQQKSRSTKIKASSSNSPSSSSPSKRGYKIKSKHSERGDSDDEDATTEIDSLLNSIMEGESESLNDPMPIAATNFLRPV